MFLSGGYKGESIFLPFPARSCSHSLALGRIPLQSQPWPVESFSQHITSHYSDTDFPASHFRIKDTCDYTGPTGIQENLSILRSLV